MGMKVAQRSWKDQLRGNTMDYVWIFIATLGLGFEGVVEVEYELKGTLNECREARAAVMAYYEMRSDDLEYWYITDCEKKADRE
jgi:hypothetical protein